MNPNVLPASTSVRSVTLVVRDLDTVARFYTEGLGFRLHDSDADSAGIGDDRATFLNLVRIPDAAPRPAEAPGLFHTAFLFPHRAELGRLLHRVAARRLPVQGFADHGVSEAIYLADPEGNGIELYTDRPRDEWRYEGGELKMVTEPLDVEGLANDATGDPGSPVTETVIGHVHLQASSLAAAEEFWVKRAGFEVVQRSFPGALFVSAGGYHHHIGLNIWRSRNQQLPPGRWTGLQSVTIGVPDATALMMVQDRLGAPGDRSAHTAAVSFETTTVEFVASSTVPHRIKKEHR